MTGLFFPDWKEHVVFSTDGPQPHVLLENDKMKVLVVGLQAGQKIPTHPEKLAVYHVLAGEGWITVDSERQAVTVGASVITLDGAARGIEAGTDLAFLAVRIVE